ncbi:hypothetical protein ACLB2K_073583 [Fragaria x ananassa]
MRPRAALLFLREHWAWACISPFLNSFSRSLSTPPNHLHQEIQPDLKLFFPLFRHFLHRFGTCYESSVLISGFIDWVIHQETRFTGIISFDGGWEASYRGNRFQGCAYGMLGTSETDPARQHHGEFNFSEVFVQQMIHSIDCVLGAVSTIVIETFQCQRRLRVVHREIVKVHRRSQQ